MDFLTTAGHLTESEIGAYTPLVREKLDAGELHASKPKNKEKNKYSSPAYKVWYFVYNAKDAWLVHWHQCWNCREVKYLIAGKGLGPLTNHRCYTAFKNGEITEPEAGRFDFYHENSKKKNYIFLLLSFSRFWALDSSKCQFIVDNAVGLDCIRQA